MSRTRYRMSVIPEPAPNTRTVLVMGPDLKGPLIQAQGDRDYSCGDCDRTLFRRVGREQIQSVVAKCVCGAFNEIPRAHQTN